MIGTAEQNAAVSVTGIVGVAGVASTQYAGTITSAMAFNGSLSLNASSTVTTAYGLYLNTFTGANTTNYYGVSIADATGATQAFGVNSGLSVGTGKWNIYASGTAANYFAGQVGIGSTPQALTGLTVTRNDTDTSGAAIYGTYSNLNSTSASGAGNKVALMGLNTFGTGYAGTGGIIGVTGIAQQNAAVGAASAIGVDAGIQTGYAGTITTAILYQGYWSNLNSATTVTNAYGLLINNYSNSNTTTYYGVSVGTVTGATSAYGLSLNLAAGTNQWNIYAGGGAPNYLAGQLMVGGTTANGLIQSYVSCTDANTTSFSAFGSYSVISSSNATGSGSKVGSYGFAQATTGFAGTSALYGVYGNAQQSAAVSANGLVGVEGTVTTGFAGTIGNAIGLQTAFSLNAASTVTTAYGVSVTAFTGANTTNYYGVNVGDATGSTNVYGVASNISSGSNKWNIYANGTAPNYFAGATTFNNGVTLNGSLVETGSHTLAQLTAATAPAGVGSTTGGTVAAATYYAKVVALDAMGYVTGAESTGVTTTGTTSSIVWSWTAVTGAASYQLWVGTSTNGESTYFASTTTSYTQTTSAGTAGTIPSTNTTGALKINNAGASTSSTTGALQVAGGIYAGQNSYLAGQLSVVGQTNASGGLRVSGSATLGTTNSQTFSYEYPTTRFYVGDGTGYSFAFSKRVGSVTTDLITIADNTGKINLVTGGTSVTPTAGDNSTSIATTAFVSNAVSGVAGGMTYQGTWNANTNTPALADGTGTKGYYYLVATAGSTSIVTTTGTVSQWNVGDMIAYDGTNWNKFNGLPSEVTTVNGQIGAVTLYAGTTALGTSSGSVTLPNTALSNSSVTIGSTSVALGATAATVAGLTLTSPTLTTPVLGTPTSGTLTNCTVATASQFDNTAKLASTAFVQTASGNYQNVVAVTGTTTLTAAQLGSAVEVSGSSTYTVTLPTPVGYTGKAFSIWNSASVAITLSTPSGNIVPATGSGASTYSMAANSSLELIADGTNWVAAFVSAGTSLTVTDNTSSNASEYLTWVSSTNTTAGTVYTSSTGLYYNPSTGTLTSTDFNSLSDETLKENVVTITNGLDVVNQLNPVSFNWKENGKQGYGVIAQEIEQILPALVATNDDGIKSVSYTQIIAFLIDAVQQLSAEVEILKNK